MKYRSALPYLKFAASQQACDSQPEVLNQAFENGRVIEEVL